MFLTRMALDESRPATRELLAFPDAVQRMVLSAFAGGNLSPLFRLDTIGVRRWLVVLSMLRPSLAAAHERYGYAGVFPSWETFDFDETIDRAERGTCWSFELTASPLPLQKRPDSALLAPERLTGWLGAAAPGCGFRPTKTVLENAWWIHRNGEYLLYSRFSGTLAVTDAELFAWSLARGVGECHDMGAGLMTISRAHTVWED